MELYTQLVVNGITNGAVYGLLAAGFVLVYRAWGPSAPTSCST